MSVSLQFFFFISFNFILITHSLIPEDSGKLKMTFQMESAKVPKNEKIQKPTMGKSKLISVKSILNIRIELEQINALMDVAVTPLCKTILHPKAHAKSLMDQAFDVVEVCVDSNVSRISQFKSINYYYYYLFQWTQDEIVEALETKCIESISAKREAIYLIEGGAGTGKTLILLNTIIKILSNHESFQSKRILFCGASNSSVDHIAESIKIRKCRNEFGKHLTYAILARNISMASELMCFLFIPTVRFGNLETIHRSQHNISIRAHKLNQVERNTVNTARLVLTTTNLAPNLLK